jgi:HK97 gp10 family phage protein
MVTGGDRLKRRLARAGDELGGKAMVGALMAGALVVQNDAKRRAPVKTGNLRRSIHIVILLARGSRAAVAVGTDAAYGRRIEFGFTDRDSLGREYNQPPRPYLRPALDNNRDEIRREVRAALRSTASAACAGWT